MHHAGERVVVVISALKASLDVTFLAFGEPPWFPLPSFWKGGALRPLQGSKKSLKKDTHTDIQTHGRT